MDKHLKMLSQVFRQVPETWSSCSTTTNAMERRNRDCKSDSPQPLKLAMINVYKIDKCTCFKHIAAQQGASISYRSRGSEARLKNAAVRQWQRKAALQPDKTAQHGLPKRTSNLVCKRTSVPKSPQEQPGIKESAISVNNSVVGFIPNRMNII